MLGGAYPCAGRDQRVPGSLALDPFSRSSLASPSALVATVTRRLGPGTVIGGPACAFHGKAAVIAADFRRTAAALGRFLLSEQAG
jgi:hypothetical protein